MHKEYLSEGDNGSSIKLSTRGLSIYYIGSTIFVSGIALIILGTALIFLFQTHYSSEPEEIMHTTISLASGIGLILVGINLMMRQTKRGYFIVIISTICLLLSLLFFITNYLQNWYYPLVSYVFALYVIGFLALLGNAFASVVVWVIWNKPDYIAEEKEKSRLYTDKEIQRDIEEATKKSLETAVAELQFELDRTPDHIVVGKHFADNPGTIIRVKDKIDEVLSLRQTLDPGTTEKWGSLGIDKASMQLAETLAQEKEKKSRFTGFRELLLKKVWQSIMKIKKKMSNTKEKSSKEKLKKIKKKKI